jgi:hypothetical protein
LYLTIAVVTLEPLMALLAVFFEEARFQNSETYGALAFCVQARSPATRCIFRILGRLKNPDHRSWAMLRGVSGWDVSKTTLALTSALATCAALWQRCVRPFLTWPWLLANVVAEEVPEATKRDIAERLAAANPCCYEHGFTAHVRKVAPTADQLLHSDVAHRLIRNTLGQASSNNIANEDRFARARNHSRTCNGNAVSPPAVASMHMLAELQAWHGIAVNRTTEGMQCTFHGYSFNFGLTFPAVRRILAGNLPKFVRMVCGFWALYVHYVLYIYNIYSLPCTGAWRS